MLDSILYFIRFSLFYFLYFIFIPSKVLGIRLSGEDAGENAVKSLAASHVTVISVVYVLGLLNIYNVYSFIALVLAVILVYIKISRKISYKKKIIAALNWIRHISIGEYNFRVCIRNMFTGIKMSLKNFFGYHIKNIFSKNFPEYAAAFASIGILISRKWSIIFSNYGYTTPDMYVHHAWINYMESGNIFSSGIYPFGMHNMISAFHKLSFLNLNIIMRYWGAFNCVLIPLMLWFMAKKLFRSNAAALIPLVIYCVTDFAGNSYGSRTLFTLPMENGIVFLLPCGYFLGKFLRSRSWKDGVWFSICSALVLAMHFYSVIMAVFLCTTVCIVFINKLFNREMIKKILLSVALIALISLTPFAVAGMKGIKWQGSMRWAVKVINGETNSDTSAYPEETETTAEDAETEITAEGDENTTGDGLAQDITEADSDDNQVEELSFFEKLKERIIIVYRYQKSSMQSYWGSVLWISMGIFLLYFFIRLILRKVTWEDKMVAAIWGLILIMIALNNSGTLGIPRIMEGYRITVFIGSTAPLIFAYPAEIIFTIMPAKAKAVGRICGYGITALLFYITYRYNYRYAQFYYHMEPSLAAKACVKIDEEYPKNTWTIVSPVEGYTLVYNSGFHYELWEFIDAMEVYKRDMNLEIPTKYVFFILEKKPILYDQTRWLYGNYENAGLDVDDARGIFKSELLGVEQWKQTEFYSIYDSRRMLEAKLYCWIQEYDKAFPGQMEVYMEDDECVVYKFTQNIFMLNNFAINYGYNEIPELDYYTILKNVKEEAGENTSWIDEIINELKNSDEYLEE